jgi:putative heme transporter
MAAFALVQRQMVSASGSRVPAQRRVELAYAANALSATLPGGSAISVAYVAQKLRGWGATAPGAVFALVASGVLSTTSFAALVLTRGVATGDRRGLLIAMVTLAVVSGVACVGRLRFRVVGWMWSAGRAGLARIVSFVHRPALSAALGRFVSDLSRVHPSRRDWLAGFALGEANWLLDLSCFLACCQAVGGTRVGLGAATAAYLVGMTASTLSFLPGCLGAVEGGMIAVLAATHVNLVAATAAVFLGRLISMVLVIVVGWIAVGLISRRNKDPSWSLRASQFRRCRNDR